HEVKNSLIFINKISMTFWFIIIALVILIILTVYKRQAEKKKYKNPTYLNNLQTINEFLALIRSLNDYVTWVQRDQLKSEYAAVGKFFRNKTNYYKREVVVKSFNEIFEDFDSYIIGHNRSYVESQKETLRRYFDHIEGKSLDDQ